MTVGAHLLPRSCRVAAAYRTVSAALFTACAFALVPTPLWPELAAQAHLNTFAVNLVFAVYALGVLAALVLGLRLTATIPAITVVRIALALTIVSALMFLISPTFVGLLAARLASGVAVGLMTSSATTVLYELAERHPVAGRRIRPARTVTAAMLGGFSCGAAGSGILVQALPESPFLPFMLCLIAATGLVGATIALHTGYSAAGAHREEPPIGVPVGRWAFVGALACTFATNSVFGLISVTAATALASYGSWAPSLWGSLVVAVMQMCGGVAQGAIPARWGAANQYIPILAFTAGNALLAIAIIAQSTPLMACGAVLAGLGGGLFVRRSLDFAGSFTDSQQRSHARITVYFTFYLGMSAPVVGAGWLAHNTTLTTAVCAFLALAATIAVIGQALVWRTRHQGKQTSRRHERRGIR